MNETQAVLLQLLKELDAFCVKHGIRYYLVGGSALGAVRHHGFLPWDDDADIVMTYEEYLKFTAAMRSDASFPPKGRSFEDPLFDKTVNVFGRYSNVETTCIFSGIAYFPTYHGIKVDVFLLLPCPDEGTERMRFMRRYRDWAEFVHPLARNRDASAFSYAVTCAVSRVLGDKLTRKILFRRLHIERYTNSSQYLYGYEKLYVFYDKEIFGKPCYFPFEGGGTFPVPTKYQAHFREIFGDDWFVVPEKTEQVVHGICGDPRRPYSFYTADYLHKAHEDRHLRRKYKASVFKAWKAQRIVEDSLVRIRSDFMRERYRQYFESHKDELFASFEEEDYFAVLELCSSYLQDQLDVPILERGLSFEVDGAVVQRIALSLLFTSQVKQARKLVSLLDDDAAPVARRLLETKDRVRDLFEVGDWEQAYSVVVSVLEEFPNDRDLAFACLDCEINHRQQIPTTPESEDESGTFVPHADLLKRYADDADFKKLLGDFHVRNGQLALAQGLYKEAALSRNGLVALQSREALDDLVLGAGGRR